MKFCVFLGLFFSFLPAFSQTVNLNNLGCSHVARSDISRYFGGSELFSVGYLETPFLPSLGQFPQPACPCKPSGPVVIAGPKATPHPQQPSSPCAPCDGVSRVVDQPLYEVTMMNKSLIIIESTEKDQVGHKFELVLKNKKINQINHFGSFYDGGKAFDGGKFKGQAQSEILIGEDCRVTSIARKWVFYKESGEVDHVSEDLKITPELCGSLDRSFESSFDQSLFKDETKFLKFVASLGGQVRSSNAHAVYSLIDECLRAKHTFSSFTTKASR